jgi:WbqC-like protein family
MIVSANQPYFAPYPGFFHKIRQSDCFVILDDVQFPLKTTWITRNRFKNDQGALWMTIPVRKKGLGLQKISDVRICHDGSWRRKHLQSLKNAYAHAPCLEDHLGLLESMFSLPYERLVDLNLAIIGYILKYLRIGTPLLRMSRLGVSGKGVPLIFDICRRLGATQYLVQTSALAYYDAAAFASRGLELIAYHKPDNIYPQMWGDFIGNLSVLDMMFTCGEKSRDIIFT